MAARRLVVLALAPLLVTACASPQTEEIGRPARDFEVDAAEPSPTLPSLPVREVAPPLPRAPDAAAPVPALPPDSYAFDRFGYDRDGEDRRVHDRSGHARQDGR